MISSFANSIISKKAVFLFICDFHLFLRLFSLHRILFLCTLISFYSFSVFLAGFYVGVFLRRFCLFCVRGVSFLTVTIVALFHSVL